MTRHIVHELMAQDARELIASIDYADYFNNRHVLLTGASGLVGLNFLVFFNELITQGSTVRVTATLNRHTVALLDLFSFDRTRIHFVRGDLSESTKFCTGEYDTIIHTANYGQPNKFMRDAQRTLRLNSTTVFELSEMLRAGGDFLFVSSSEVYNGCTHVPHRECDIGVANTDHARACYIEGKRFGEVVMNTLRDAGYNAVSSRLAMSYGPGTRPDDVRVMQQFIWRALFEGELRLLDAGAARRAYCYITDAVDTMLRMIVRGRQGVYNCGGTSMATIRGLAETIARECGVEAIVPESGCGSEGAPADVALDLSLVHTDLNKRGFISLEEGIRRTIRWQREMYGALK